MFYKLFKIENILEFILHIYQFISYDDIRKINILLISEESMMFLLIRSDVNRSRKFNIMAHRIVLKQ
jgi:hypothetical protein